MTSEDFEDDGSGYGTHLPFLRFLFQAYEINDVLEFGMGNFSTKFFLFNDCNVCSIEQQEKSWYDKMTSEIKKKNWHPILNLGPEVPVQIIDKLGPVDLAFIDGHMDSRANCVNYLFHKAKMIVAHDFEYEGYNWHKIEVPPDYVKIIYYDGNLQTALFINKQNLKIN
jgi:hypothetical protein